MKMEDTEMAKGQGEIVTDPVCGMGLNKRAAAALMNYEGQTLYFCSDSCYRHFRGNPRKYARGSHDKRDFAKPV